MADQMERALAIAVVQADENVALGNALAVAERTIADLRRQLAAVTNDHGRIQNTIVNVADGYQHVIAEMRKDLETTRARLDSVVRLLGEIER